MAAEAPRSAAELEEENARLRRELAAALAREAEGVRREEATGEVLRIVASSSNSLQPVLSAVAEAAARVCGAEDAHVRLLEENRLRLVARYGTVPGQEVGEDLPAGPGSVGGRAIVERRTVHVGDLAAEPADRFPEARALAERFGFRSVVAAPLLRDGTPIGNLALRRRDARPFTDTQIRQLETFADQVVIAIENARLFQDLEQSNRDLTEALDQQTATADVLRVIASSPTDPERVLQSILDTAARLCEAPSGALLQFRERDGRLAPRAVFGKAWEAAERDRRSFESAPGVPVALSVPGSRAYIERRTIQLDDLAEGVRAEYADARNIQALLGLRSVVYVPLLRHGTAIGVLAMQRLEVRPFTEREIALVETFADQAVIAIENARLFEELAQRNQRVERDPGAADGHRRGAARDRLIAHRPRNGPASHHGRGRQAVRC